jgi:hypothetical protein
MLLRNIGVSLNCTALQHKRPYSSTSYLLFFVIAYNVPHIQYFQSREPVPGLLMADSIKTLRMFENN